MDEICIEWTGACDRVSVCEKREKIQGSLLMTHDFIQSDETVALCTLYSRVDNFEIQHVAALPYMTEVKIFQSRFKCTVH
jgi:hypothetical protein